MEQSTKVKLDKCGCYIDYYEGFKDKPDSIIYCSLHNSAFDLYKALHTIRCGGIYDHCADWLQERIDEALAKAEGK